MKIPFTVLVEFVGGQNSALSAEAQIFRGAIPGWCFRTTLE